MKRIWIAKFFLFGLLALALIGLITQSLWNWLVPDLFGGPAIDYWQALGLLALTKILFWTFGKGGRPWQHRMGQGRYWMARWESMSPEDRERFKQKLEEKWCRPAKAPDTAVPGPEFKA